MRKVIFLDIDGVLNHRLFYESGQHKNLEYPYCDIDPTRVEFLNNIVEHTHADVVCSSTWRKMYSPAEIEDILVACGYRYQILDNTPILSFKSYSGTVPRGCEIQAWIDKNISGNISVNLKYVILDDDSDMLLWQRENYFHVDSYCGLTPNIVYRVEKFLNKG